MVSWDCLHPESRVTTVTAEPILKSMKSAEPMECIDQGNDPVIDRVKTGIIGLDELIEGGFPRNSLNLVAGPAGSGKTLMGIQYIYNGAREFDEKGVYITLEESRDNILRAVRRYHIDFESLENNLKLLLMDMGTIRLMASRGTITRMFDHQRDLESQIIETGIIDFEALQMLLAGEQGILATTGATRLVIDSVTALGLHYTSVEDLRLDMFRFSRFLKEHKVTCLLITESIEGQYLTRYGIEQFMTDSFIVLRLENQRGELRRTLNVRKMRFTNHDSAIHPYIITQNGMEISSKDRVY